jgi:hypothetical protein
MWTQSVPVVSMLLQCWSLLGKGWTVAFRVEHSQTIFRFQNRLWMDSEVFCERKCHFISVVKPMPQEKVLLIFRWTQQSHAESGCYWSSSKHEIVMVRLPSQSTHLMRRLDVTFFQDILHTLGISDRSESERLSTKHIASLAGTAFPRAATMETAMNGLRNSGLWPVDRFVIQTNYRWDCKFQPEFCT